MGSSVGGVRCSAVGGGGGGGRGEDQAYRLVHGRRRRRKAVGAARRADVGRRVGSLRSERDTAIVSRSAATAAQISRRAFSASSTTRDAWAKSKTCSWPFDRRSCMKRRLRIGRSARPAGRQPTPPPVPRDEPGAQHVPPVLYGGKTRHKHARLSATAIPRRVVGDGSHRHQPRLAAQPLLNLLAFPPGRG